MLDVKKSYVNNQHDQFNLQYNCYKIIKKPVLSATLYYYNMYLDLCDTRKKQTVHLLV